MTTLALTSDVHWNVRTNTNEILGKYFRKLGSENFDILIIAGDIGSSRPEDFTKCLKRCREFVKQPIVAVRGNHDLWQDCKGKGSDSFTSVREKKIKRKKLLTSVIEEQNKVAEDLNIHLLEKGPFSFSDIDIFGWDGWYAFPPDNRGTKDDEMLPIETEGIPTDEWLRKRAHAGVGRVLEEIENSKANKKVVITHMPLFSITGRQDIMNGSYSYWDFIKGVDVFCFGHIHLKVDSILDGTRLYCSGSDYDKPATTFFEV